MNIPVNYYFATDFPEIAAEHERGEDEFVTARLEEISQMYSSGTASLTALQKIVHRLFRREFPIQKSQLGYANAGETARAFVLTRFEKFKSLVRSLAIENDLDKGDLHSFCRSLESQLLANEFDAKRIYFFERDGEIRWDIHGSQKVKPTILTETDCYIFQPILTGMPPSESDLAALKAREETFAAQLQAGKHLIKACCPVTEGIIRGALKIGLTEMEIEVFNAKFGEGGDYHTLRNVQKINSRF